MPDAVDIRPTRPGDLPALEALYPAAFPEEDLLPLVRALLGEPRALSLAVEETGALLAHAALTLCTVEGAAGTVALLGPVAVPPERQRAGLGGALIREGLARVAAQGALRALVLGDPAYYARFGFRPEPGVAPPFPIPEAWAEAWQGLALAPDAPATQGRLTVPAPWADPALWAA